MEKKKILRYLSADISGLMQPGNANTRTQARKKKRKKIRIVDVYLTCQIQFIMQSVKRSADSRVKVVIFLLVAAALSWLGEAALFPKRPLYF